jgi:1,4-alpha-glucan branching enzyme
VTLGRLAIVLHSHSPWLLGHGSWPVGEEWLRQAWAQAYLPLVTMLRSRAEQGQTAMLTLGVTPVLAAQWDEPSSIAEQERWIEDWRVRATGKAIEASISLDDDASSDATRQFQLADAAAREFAEHWQAGGSAALRPLADAGAIEVLGGPMTHTFTPHLLEPIADLAFASGLTDSTVRLGRRPRGVWTPECAYRPGVEELLARHDVTHTVFDGPTLQSAGAELHRPHRIAHSDVVAFGRDLALTYRVWSPRKGYPGSPWYQDFHTFDHEWGVRSSRVTHRSSPEKKPYDPVRAREQITKDAADFLATARQLMRDSNESNPLVTAAYDTELFGHWWHEGPLFLDAVLDGAADAGIELTTLERERERAFDQPPIELNSGSWGSGKDFRVWEDGEAGALRDIGKGTQYAVVEYLRSRTSQEVINRDVTGDAIVTELLLGLASDWAFMITKDSAADYARNRAHEHFRNVADLLRSDHHDAGGGVLTRDVRLPFVDSRLARAH